MLDLIKNLCPEYVVSRFAFEISIVLSLSSMTAGHNSSDLTDAVCCIL
jgi:hypothetical protein